MPTYDYQCRSCGSVTEVIHSMLEDGPSVCERCGGDLRRVLYPTGIIFKGSGFYRTDSRGADASGSTDAKPAPAKDAAKGDGATKGGDRGDAKPKAGSEAPSGSATT